MQETKIVKIIPLSAEDLAIRDTLQTALTEAQAAERTAQSNLYRWHHETLVKLYPEHYKPATPFGWASLRKPAASLKIVDNFAVIGLEAY